MKKISVSIPCWAEEKSVRQMYERLTKVFREQLPQYDYEIIYVDDYSPDNTREEIRKLCAENRRVKAVFNVKNFGFNRNVFAALQYGTGTLPLCCLEIYRIHRRFCHRWWQNGKRAKRL